MDLDDALGAAYGAMARRPADLLPLYFVGAAAVQVARTSIFVAVAAAYLLLAADGRVAAFRDALGGRVVHPDATTPDEFVEGVSVDQLAELARTHLADPEAAAVLALGLLGFLALQVAATAVANAGKLHAVRTCLAGERGAVRAGAAGLRGDGPTMVGVAGLRAVAVVAVLAAVQVAGTVGGPVAGALAVLAALPVFLVLYLAFMFAPQAVVVDGTGATGAVRASLRFVADEPATVVLYVVVAFGVAGTVGLLATVFAFLSVSQVTGPVVWFLALPVLDLVKTGIYVDDGAATGKDGAAVTDGPDDVAGGDGEPTDGAAAVDGGSADDAAAAEDGPTADAAAAGEPTDDGAAAGEPTDDAVPSPNGRTTVGADAANGRTVGRAAAPTWGDPPAPSVRLRAALRRGLAELGAFVRDAPLLVALSLALLAVGGAAGFRVTAPFEFTVVRTEPVGATFGPVPVDVFVALAVNNWTVAVTASFAGLAAGVPAAASMLFNGVVVGAVAGLGYDPVVLTALVAPHGVVEFPALAISGALGLHLGREGVQFARGRRSAAAMAAALRRAFDVLVGLAVLFVVAAFVEAFLTPAIASLVAG